MLGLTSGEMMSLTCYFHIQRESIDFGLHQQQNSSFEEKSNQCVAVVQGPRRNDQPPRVNYGRGPGASVSGDVRQGGMLLTSCSVGPVMLS